MADALDAHKPAIGAITRADLVRALRLGWADFMAAPQFGLFFAGVLVVVGWAFIAIVQLTGASYWLVFAITGFPMVGPFLAVGLYEVSRRRAQSEALAWPAILGVINGERGRQLPWLCAVILIALLFWIFLAHLIFALFFGLSSLINISSSYGEFFKLNGLAMLGFGGMVGAGFAAIIYAMSVFGIPMVMRYEVDFITASLLSAEAVKAAPMIHLQWAALLAVLSFLALLPGFVGLFLVFPVLGHASWHLFDLADKRT